ncbi:MAG: ABC transporter substrate-binding protein, partial [Bacteroidota bacterium]
LSTRFIEQFNTALQMGLDAIPDLEYLLQSPHPDFDLKQYFTHNISYELDSPKREALNLFLSSIQENRGLVLVG